MLLGQQKSTGIQCWASREKFGVSDGETIILWLPLPPMMPRLLPMVFAGVKSRFGRPTRCPITFSHFMCTHEETVITESIASKL